MRRSIFPILGLTVALAAAPARGDEPAPPWFQANLQTFLQFDGTTRANGGTLTDLSFTAYGSGVFHATDWLSFDFLSTFEPISDATDDRVFQNHGLYLNSFEANAAFGPLSVSVGKFSPNFGLGYLLTPGMNWDTFNGDVELKERIGVRASYNLTGEGSANGFILSAGVFRRDTSVFSDSAFYHRGQLQLSDGGPGNHGGLQSFSLGADWIAPEWAPGLHAHAAYLHQHAGLGDVSDARAWVASLNWACDLDEDTSYQLIGEVAHSTDSIGFGEATSVPGASQTIVTLGAGGKWQDVWVGSVVFGQRNTRDPGSSDTDEWFTQLTVGRYLTDEVSLEAGWQENDDGTAVSDTFSLRLVGVFDYARE